MVFEAITFGVVVAFIILGIVGTAVPIVPGTLLIWLGVAVYAWYTGFTAVSVAAFIIISLIALVTGTADLWLPLTGARIGGASKRALLFGTAGALVGTFILPIPFLGSIAGYLLGLLLGEYQKRGDWELAKKASFSGLAGWAVATAVQVGGGMIILLIFVIQVLTT